NAGDKPMASRTPWCNCSAAADRSMAPPRARILLHAGISSRRLRERHRVDPLTRMLVWPLRSSGEAAMSIVHLVGSVPLADAESVFRTVSKSVGPYLAR